MQGSKIKDKNLFYMANLIDQKVEKAKKKAVLFIGMSKVGKSTAFNWVAGKHIQPYLKSQQNILYQLSTSGNSTTGQESAIISHEIVSCTLVPNILNIEDYSLIDMAGFQDTRDYIGTVGVAYSLKAVFQAINQVKFILVISESSLIDMRMPNDLIHGFINFFEMFKLNQLSTHSKDSLFRSTSILVTRSKNPASIPKNLQSFLKQVSNPKLKIKDYKTQLLKCLQSIIVNSRFTYFKQANIEQQPQASNIMQILNFSKKWSYFEMKNVKIQDLSRKQQSIIKFPFEALFQKLQAQQKQQIIRQIQARIQSYVKFQQIITKCIVPLLQEQYINQIKFDQQYFFTLINQFITNNDHYESMNYILKINQKNKLQIPTKLQGLKEIIKIQQIIYDVGNHENCGGSFKFNIPLFKIYYQKLTNVLMNIYGSTVDNVRSIMRLSFILERGIKQFEMLYDISTYHVSDANIKILNSINSINILRQKQIVLKYIRSFNKILSQNRQNLIKYFDKNNTCDNLHTFLKQFQNDQFISKQQIFYQLFRDIKLILAKDKKQKIHKKQTTKKQMKRLQEQNGKMLIEALEVQYRLQKYLLEKDQPLNDAKMKIEYMRRIQILNLLKQNAVDVNKLQIAKLIAQYNRQTHSTILIFQKILTNNKLPLLQRKGLLNEYAEFCYNSYKIQKAVECLEKISDIEGNFDQKMKINKKIEEYINGQQKSKLIYLNSLKSQRIIQVDENQSINLLTKLKKQF